MLSVEKLVHKAPNANNPPSPSPTISTPFGALEFSRAALKAGVQPIIGAEVYLDDDGGDGAAW